MLSPLCISLLLQQIVCPLMSSIITSSWEEKDQASSTANRFITCFNSSALNSALLLFMMPGNLKHNRVMWDIALCFPFQYLPRSELFNIITGNELLLSGRLVQCQVVSATRIEFWAAVQFSLMLCSRSLMFSIAENI